MNAINTFLNWVTRLALLNVLALAFTIISLGVLGLFPALSASFAITRKWVSGETDIPVVRSFWKYFKRDFWKSNLLGYMIAAVSYILYLDFVFLTVYPGDVTSLLTIPFIIISTIFILTVLYIFPVFVHFQMTPFQVIKSAFFIMLSNPFPTLMMAVGVLGIAVIIYLLQGLVIFFGISVLSVAIMMPAYRAFQKTQNKEEATA